MIGLILRVCFVAWADSICWPEFCLAGDGRKSANHEFATGQRDFPALNDSGAASKHGNVEQAAHRGVGKHPSKAH